MIGFATNPSSPATAFCCDYLRFIFSTSDDLQSLNFARKPTVNEDCTLLNSRYKACFFVTVAVHILNLYFKFFTKKNFIIIFKFFFRILLEILLNLISALMLKTFINRVHMYVIEKNIFQQCCC